MLVTPQTTIQLLDTPLVEDQENQLTWNSVSAQQQYFEGLPSLLIDGCSYQREGGFIRVPKHIEQIRQYNYVAYKNSNYTDKVFYAFITGMEYANDNMTRVYLKTDVWQTWWNQMQFKPSFVEREHVNDDTIGLHTYPENLETGDYIMVRQDKLIDFQRVESIFCIQVTDIPSNAGIVKSQLPRKVYSGLPSGCWYIFVLVDDIDALSLWIDAYNADGKQDAILAIFPLANALTNTSSSAELTPLTNTIFEGTYILNSTTAPTYFQTAYNIAKPTNFQGYTPKNNKLFTWPYINFYFDSQSGSSVEYKFEDFNGDPSFRLMGSISVGGEYKIYPYNVINQSSSLTGLVKGITLASLPQGSWNTDAYNNWKALNSDALAIQTKYEVLNAGVNAAGGLLSAFTGDIAGGVARTVGAGLTAAQAIESANNQRTVAQRIPDQARGDTRAQGLMWSSGNNGMFVTQSIKREYAEIIDQFFTMYGYRVNSLKVPNITGRANWNYVKTLNANITGSIPQAAITEMEGLLDRGITFWHNPATMYDYSTSNSIV